ncbi:PASTA domain-containing protein [Intestinibacillus massiliensis]|nr:PASTA domain-containing protein [Intestinibacillus massiliensis]
MPIKGPNNQMRIRLAFLIVCFVFLGFSVVAVRLFYMQVVKYDYYQEKAMNFQTRDTVVTPTRGTIYDRNMKELAVSATTETVVVAPVNVLTDTEKKNPAVALAKQEKLSRILSEKLGVTYETVLTKVQKEKSQYEVIKKGVEKETVEDLKAALKEEGVTAGISTAPDSKRYYPYGSFASQVIGFLNSDGVGQEGIEKQYEKELAGTAGRVVRATNAKGRDMPFEYEQYIPAEDGNSVVLTVDEAIQHFLEKHLETAYADNPQARGGVAGIVMDVKTGEILALAGKPNFDLNAPREITEQAWLDELRANINKILAERGSSAQISDAFLKEGGKDNLPESVVKDETRGGKKDQTLLDDLSDARMDQLMKMWRNKPIMDTYEPGSTFKLMNVATAYELGVVNASSTFFCPGYQKVADRTIKCWKHAGHGSEDLTHTLMNSCNPAMIQISMKTGTQNFYEYFKAFGFQEKTGIDLPGEQVGYFWPSDTFTELNMATASFGQRFTVTPIQELSMACAVVDDGRLKTPHVVKEIVDKDGNVKQTFETEVKRQVVSADTSAFMRQAMEQVVAAGTGMNGYVAGYRVGGKTATSELLKKEGDVEDRYTASFIGIAPMDDPQVAVLVMVDDLPESVVHGGGAVAAPVVARVLNDVLPYLGVEAQYGEDEADRREVAAPNVIGQSRADAEAAAKEAGLECKFVGDGDTVTDQVPSSGAKVPVTARMILYCGGTKSTEQIEVPRVTGLTPSEAQERLRSAGLYMKRTGIASKMDTYMTNAAKQSPVAGTKVGAGTVVTVEFSNSVNIGD